ncbi:patatin-like phospholipase domain-containing protein 5 isoform X4 [Cervus canadensis]|uniref:patatin-like phospholipase domain-containing protein 5 isoform X4 n=1 Tax=Cervus canadensis TaxID=1574408 RepID=UPI001CA31F41|nr:patatin-like phospholipase domain-containing protein 5 isoform X4 [Cervus canadensis]
MSCFEKEGSWSLSFAGAGFLGLYHVGVVHCLRQRAPRLLRGASRFYGSSSGALVAVSVVSGLSVDLCCSRLMAVVKQVEQLSLGVFHPAFTPIETIRQDLQDWMPADVHILASQRLGISLTHCPNGENVIVTDFATRDEVIEALVCSVYFPFYCGTIPPTFRGKRYIDGALSNNLPFADSPSAITVSPFHGTVDICPQSCSASIHELNAFNASFQISTENFFLGITSLIPCSPEVMADSCRQGYLDALRFLERRALKKACMRDPGAWASFCRSGPGQALTYLLLPCTLPFEYVYFRSRRLVAWLPDVPADLWWMQGLLRSLALEVYSRTKDQLLRLVGLLVASPLQPKADPPKDLAKEPRPTHQA